MSRADLLRILGGCRSRPTGAIAGLASRLLAGRPLGPFRYEGRRGTTRRTSCPTSTGASCAGCTCSRLDQPRGRSAPRTRSTCGSPGRPVVRAPLPDRLRLCLGSGAIAKRSYPTGTEYFFDYGVVARQVATLGCGRSRGRTPSIRNAEHRLHRVGELRSRAWRPYYPNPAFDERTGRDLRWGAGHRGRLHGRAHPGRGGARAATRTRAPRSTSRAC